MKAVALKRFLPLENPSSLLDIEIDAPAAPVGHDLLVRVKAVSVNPVDNLTRSRAARDCDEAVPQVLGWDAAGTVVSVGPEATRFRPGDPVFYAGSVTRPGCDCELHLVDERIVGKKPKTLSFAEAAALPLTSVTAWELLFDRLGVSRTGADAGKTALVLGGAGGVGSIALQLAKRLSGLRVIASASRPESAKWALELGADLVIDHLKPLADELKRVSEPEVDFLLCLNDTDRHFPAFASIIKPQGKIASIVPTTKPVDLAPLFAKSVSFAWELLFTRSMFGTSDMAEQHQLLNQVAELVERGVLRTTMTQHFGALSAESLRRALQALEGGHVIGKLVLEVD